MQLVGYDRTPEPALVVADDGAIDRVPLEPGTTIEFGLGERTCGGTVEGDTHRSCDRPAAPWCDVHTETWICARCRGTCLKDEMDCYDPHVVYLAIVAPDAVKVGVTKAHRFERRIHEQGADRGAVIHEVENGRIAREIEAELGRDLPERIRTAQKLRGLRRSIDEAAWTALVGEYDPIRVHEPTYELDLETQPIPETLATGRIVGTKGRLVVLERGDSLYATDLRDLVGYRVQEGADTRDLQSGLGAFGT